MGLASTDPGLRGGELAWHEAVLRKQRDANGKGGKGTATTVGTEYKGGVFQLSDSNKSPTGLHPQSLSRSEREKNASRYLPPCVLGSPAVESRSQTLAEIFKAVAMPLTTMNQSRNNFVFGRTANLCQIGIISAASRPPRRV